jgi:hypothetical protein
VLSWAGEGAAEAAGARVGVDRRRRRGAALLEVDELGGDRHARRRGRGRTAQWPAQWQAGGGSTLASRTRQRSGDPGKRGLFLKKNRRGRGLGGADVADSRGSSLSFRLPSSMFVCKAQVWH